MNFEVALFLFILALSTTVSIGVAYFMFTHRTAPGAIFYGLMELSCMFWNIGYMLEIIGHTLIIKMIGVKIQYFFGIPFVSLFWAVGALSFTTYNKRPTLLEFISLSIIPFTTMILALLMESHSVFYQNTRLIQVGSFLLIEKDWGFWFYIHVIYSYLLNFIGTLILAYAIKKETFLLRRQIIFLIISMILPWLASITYVTGMKSYSRLDFTNAAFTFSAAIIGWNIFRYGLFDLVPTARDAVIESLKRGIIVLDSKGRIVDINAAAKKIFRRKPEIGENFKIFLNTFSLSKLSTVSERNESADVTIGDRIFEINISEIKTSDRGQRGKILSFFDITDRKNTEKELHELNASKDKFFSIIAHDLRNPFFGIMGLAQLLTDKEENLTPEEEQEIKKQIHDLSTNTYRMLENLLEWSRSQTGKLEFNPERIEVCRIIKDTTDLLTNSAQIKNIQLVNSCETQLNAYADPNMISTVLRNLISNAIKFTPQNGTISINSRRSVDKIEIFVKDNGIGMNQKTVDGLFQIDKSVKTIGTAGEKGTGLGLLLCKEFVEKNGGQLKVESTLGKGTTFTFSLPVSKFSIG